MAQTKLTRIPASLLWIPVGGGCHTDAYFANASNLGFFHRVNIIKIFHAAIVSSTAECTVPLLPTFPSLRQAEHHDPRCKQRYRTNFLVVPNLLLSASRQPPRRCQEAPTKHPIYVHHGWRKTFLLNPEQGDRYLCTYCCSVRSAKQLLRQVRFQDSGAFQETRR